MLSIPGLRFGSDGLPGSPWQFQPKQGQIAKGVLERRRGQCRKGEASDADKNEQRNHRLIESHLLDLTSVNMIAQR